MNRQPDLGPNIFRLLDYVIEDKPVSKNVLAIMIKLSGFERGGVFLAGKNNELKLAVSIGIKDDRKAVESLVRGSGITALSPVEYEPDTTKLSWFRTAHQLKGSFILSYACIAITRGKKQYGILYLDSVSSIEPINEADSACLSRLARVMLAALLHDQVISVPTIAASDYLSSHSIRDLERERLLAVLKRHDWHVFSASQELGTKLRVLYSQMERLEIEPPRQGKHRKRDTVLKVRQVSIEV